MQLSRITYWLVSTYFTFQRGQTTAEMSPPVASERVSVVVTGLGSLPWYFDVILTRFSPQNCCLGTLETVLCPSLLTKFQVDGDGDDGFFYEENNDEYVCVSHVRTISHQCIFHAGWFINPIPPKPSITQHTTLRTKDPAFSWRNNLHLLICLPCHRSHQKSKKLPYHGWKYLNVLFVVWLPWIARVFETTAINQLSFVGLVYLSHVGCPSLWAVHDSRPSPRVDSQQLR